MRRLAFFTALIGISLSIAAPACTGTEYPTLEYKFTDQVGVLYGSEIYDIEGVCASVYSQTGAEMAVLVVNTTQPDGITIFTVETFEKNGLGQEGEDNGLLLVVSTGESAWRIEVGYGLQGVLSNSRVGMLADDVLVPHLNQSYYYDGIYETVLALGQIIVDEYVGEPAKEKNPYPISFIPLTFWQLVLAIVVIVVLTIVTKGRIIFWLPFLLSGGKGGKNWGGGRSGGGGEGGK